MAITKMNRLNMTGGGVPVIVRLSQYDQDFTLIFELYSTDGTFTVESGTTAEVRGTKSDGTGFSATATLDISNKKVTVTGDQQMTAVSGKAVFELTLWKNDKELNTANFILDIEPAALDRSTITSESKILELLDVTDQADDIIAAAEQVVNAIDATLTQAGKAADAKTTGDAISGLRAEIDSIEPLSDDAKTALLNCFAHVAWIDEHGQNYYDALESALYANTYPKITAVFDAGVNVIYTDDSLNSLKQYLTVKYYEAEGSAAVIVPSTDYTLYGTLTEGSNTLRATYEGLSASFVVDNVIDFYNIWEWNITSENIVKYGVGMFANQQGVNTLMLNPYTTSTPRNTPVVMRGKKPYLFQASLTESTYYPIPVPKTAAKIIVTTNETKDYYYGYRVNKLDESTGVYAAVINSPWSKNYTTNISPQENLFMGINIKKGTAGTEAIDPSTYDSYLNIQFE